MTSEALLVHEAASVKVGEVYRYTVTYTPSKDSVFPIPENLYLRVKNNCFAPLRAAYIKGPYTLYVSVCREEFDPYVEQKCETSDDPGVPMYDPHVKAGSSFYAVLPVPESIRKEKAIEEARALQEKHKDDGIKEVEVKEGRKMSVTWIIEVVSQIIFSASSSVPFEILLGKDEECLDHNHEQPSTSSPQLLATVLGSGNHRNSAESLKKKKAICREGPPAGALNKAIRLKVQDTRDLWNTPPFPSWADKPGTYQPLDPKDAPDPEKAEREREFADCKGEEPDNVGKNDTKRRTRKVHLVILTHGMHSNVGADLLFLKEQIDEEAKRTAEAIKRKKEEDRAKGLSVDDEEPELVLCRGYEGNSCRTERGIKFLGKHLAKYVINLTTDPDGAVCTRKSDSCRSSPHAADPSIYDGPVEMAPYKITSISFIGHSLGGLVQTYAIAYIQKHHPWFFEEIQPINFVALATPFLGLSNENPLHVRFALDFGLVGRTGQDLGLSWRAPTVAASALSYALHNHTPQKTDFTKPLLRILPTGPAHDVLKKFRNRTVYANVVNDGIVPLRTSCLLFLDWKSLGKVEKVRRENGVVIVGGLVTWGWGQLTSGSGNPSGAATPTPRPTPAHASSSADLIKKKEVKPIQEGVNQEISKEEKENKVSEVDKPGSSSHKEGKLHPFHALASLFRPHGGKKRKSLHKIYRRSQTLQSTSESSMNVSSPPSTPQQQPFPQPQLSPTSENERRPSVESFDAPPRTTVIEAAGDLLNPPLPSTEFIINPSSRPRVIYHDRVYHPEDIPPVPTRPAPSRSFTFPHRSPPPSAPDSVKSPSENQPPPSTPVQLKPEEKIARAYHAECSWRKVLVRLEPDAHNNLIVRRTFANAYGWPVIRHLVDTHFSQSITAQLPDAEEAGVERAREVYGPEAGNGDGWKGGMSETVEDAKLEAVPEGRRRRASSVGSRKWTDSAFMSSPEGGVVGRKEEEAVFETSESESEGEVPEKGIAGLDKVERTAI